MRPLVTDARNKLRTLLVDGFFEGTARMALLHPRARPAKHGLERLRDIDYGAAHGAKHHMLDVWRPLDHGRIGTRAPHHQKHSGPPWPIVFYVHGGSFRILSKDTHWIMGLAFARRGFIVFNVNYRLAPKHPYPAAISDVCDAYAWVAKNAARFGGDPSRMVLAGESAGANLVTSLALALSYERPETFAKRAFDTGLMPCAVVPACGLFQVSDMERLRRRKPGMSPFVADLLPTVAGPYLGKGPWECGLDLADPVVFFERGEKPARPLPPFFLPVGTRDPLLPDTRRLGSALRALGTIAEEKYYPGEMHAFHAFVMRKAARECWADTYAFLDRHVPA
jgi:acetyl esterase